jgi:predicted Fe-Mo cluster-binding NifX family protein
METTAMRVAIPTRGERISPVFDAAGQVLLVDFEEEKESSRCVAPLPADPLTGRVTRLRELGVTALICGGISRTLRQMIEADGIHVYPWTAGPVAEVLEAYRQGRLHEPQWMMPGCSDAERTGMQDGGARVARSGRRSRRLKGDLDPRR